MVNYEKNNFIKLLNFNNFSNNPIIRYQILNREIKENKKIITNFCSTNILTKYF